jgi:hypothetical protein
MKKFVVVLLAGVLSACATQGAKVDPDKLSQLKPGVSTISDAKALFGEPESSSRHQDGTTTLTYGFSSTTTDGKSLIPIVGGFIGKPTKSSIDYTMLTFDKSDHFLKWSNYQRN